MRIVVCSWRARSDDDQGLRKQLRAMQGTMAHTDADLGRLETRFSIGLRKAFAGCL